MKTKDFLFSLDFVSKIVWGPVLLLLVITAGVFLTAASGFYPIRKIGFVFKNTVGKIFQNKKSFAAAATALGATVGTGNIVGVASAIALGGPGAVFWMWIGAFFGMMLKFAEAALAVRCKGGANIYIEKAFGCRFFSAAWCICCVLASFGGGNMIQTAAAAKTFENSFGMPPFIIGGAISLAAAFVLFRGAGSVTKTSAVLVPVMAAVYVLGCFSVLLVFHENIIPAFEKIFCSAFEPLSLGGGISGILVSESLRIGISRGTFTHEAGMGSASLAHAESGEKNPEIQGCWGIIEVFTDTIFVCTLTALVILSVPESGSAEEVFRSVFGFFGDIFLCVSMFLFALAAVIGWAFYGEKALSYITENSAAKNIYRFIFCLAAAIGAFMEMPVIWSVTDIFNGLMVFPNLAAIIALSPEILKIAKEKPAF